MQLFHLTKSAVNQIAKNRTGKFKFGLKAGLTFDMPVLRLAGRHFGKVKSKLLKLGCRYVQVISLDILRTP